MVVYAPTEDNRVNEEFYRQLGSSFDVLPVHDVKILRFFSVNSTPGLVATTLPGQGLLVTDLFMRRYNDDGFVPYTRI